MSNDVQQRLLQVMAAGISIQVPDDGSFIRFVPDFDYLNMGRVPDHIQELLDRGLLEERTNNCGRFYVITDTGRRQAGSSGEG